MGRQEVSDGSVSRCRADVLGWLLSWRLMVGVLFLAIGGASANSPPPPASIPGLQPLPADLYSLDLGLVFRAQSRFSFWGFDVYDASLWTAPDFNPDVGENQTLALELRYLRDFSNHDIAKRTVQEMRGLASLGHTQEQAWLKEMRRVFPNVRKGDRLLGVHRVGQSAVFWHNGKPAGEIADAEFARLFFGIWLSPKTSAPALRQALIGGKP